MEYERLYSIKGCLLMRYIVSGYWRSGTNMMLAAALAGGMDVRHSPAKESEQDAHFSRPGYVPQPGGFCTTDPAILPALPDETVASAIAGDVCKLPRQRSVGYSVAFMLRKPAEIVVSLRKLFNSPQSYLTVGDVARVQQVWTDFLRNRPDTLVTLLQYADVVANPMRELATLGWPMDVTAAAAKVNPDWYRERVA